MPVDPVPEHLHTLTPRLVLAGAQQAIEFYQQAFGAELLDRPFVGPHGGVVHAEMRIGDSVFFLMDEGGDGEGISPKTANGGVTAMMALMVPDADTVWDRAVAAGCEVIYPLADQFYGERGGRLRDPFGQQWMVSSRIEDLTMEEIERRMQDWVEQQDS